MDYCIQFSKTVEYLWVSSMNEGNPRANQSGVCSLRSGRVGGGGETGKKKRAEKGTPRLKNDGAARKEPPQGK